MTATAATKTDKSGETKTAESLKSASAAATPRSEAGDEVDQTEPSPAERLKRRRRQPPAVLLLATLATLYSVYFARAILMPIVMALMLALLFRPVVRRGRKYRIPEAVCAAAVLAMTLGTISLAASYLFAPAQEWIDHAPEYMREVGVKLRVVREQIEDLHETTTEVQNLAVGADPKPKVEVAATPFPFTPETSPDILPVVAAEPVTAETDVVSADGDIAGDGLQPVGTVAQPAEPVVPQDEPVQAVDRPIPVEVRQPRLITGLTLLTSTTGVMAELVLMLVLAFFLLSSGDVLINNVLRVLPTMREKRHTVELVHNVEYGISSYLFTVTCINIGLGVAIGIAMWMFDIPNPVLWGVMAAILNFVPYIGALVGVCIIFLVAVLSFDSLAYATLVPLAYFTLTSLEGNIVTPHMLGRSMSLNPIMVFLSLTFWGWMWGIGGAILAVPILAVLKVGFDQFERTEALGTLLGGNSSG